MHPIASFVRNPVKVAVGVLLVALFGVVGLLRMPMQLTPEVEAPVITIETRWRGASPEEVEREIILEQEEQLASVEGVTKMSSECADSSGKITLEFLVGTDMQEALVKVNSRLQQVREYPEEADEPVISTSSAADRAIGLFILSARAKTAKEIKEFIDESEGGNKAELEKLLEPVLHALRTDREGLAVLRLRRLFPEHPELAPIMPPDLDVPEFRDFAEDFIETEFERVKGVSNSNVIGGQERELQVIVDPRRLAGRQITFTDVRAALRGENKDTSAGDFWEQKRRWVVRAKAQFRSIEEVENLLITVRNGKPVYVRDVIVENGVRLGFKKPEVLVRRFGTAAIAINAERTTGANVLDVMEGLRKVNARLNDGVLASRGLQLTQVYDETDYIYSAVGLVNQNIVVGGLLTVAVLLIFLRSGRSTLVIFLAIPTSIVGTFLILSLLGRSLNVISLAGLAFAVGMLVDNAVVVLENIYRHYQLGRRPVDAAVAGTKEVWGAVIASTLTTLAVFLPVLFIAEEAGQLFRDIALAISAAVGLSLVVSATVIPTATSRLFREGRGRKAGRPEHDGQRAEPSSRRRKGRRGFGKMVSDWIVDANAWIQRSYLTRWAVVVVLVGASFLLSWLLWPKVEYLPTGNRNLVIGLLFPPPGYNLDKMMALGSAVEEGLRPYWDVDPGSPAAEKLDGPPIGDWFYVVRGRQVFMGVRSTDSTQAHKLVGVLRAVPNKIGKTLRDLEGEPASPKKSDEPPPGLYGAFFVANQSSLFERGLAASRAIDIEITGPDLEKLVGFGGSIMGQVPQVVRMPRGVDENNKPAYESAQARPVPSLDLSSPEVHVKPIRRRAAELQMTATDLGYAVDAMVDGAYATDYYVGGDKIDLTIMGDQNYVQRTQDVAVLPIATRGSTRPVTLSSLANVEFSSGPEQINRRERRRAITIQVTPPPDMPLADAIERIENDIVAPLRESGQLGDDYVINLSGTADKLADTWDALQWNFVLAVFITYLLMAALFESWLYPFVIILTVPLAAVGGIVGLNLLNVYLGWLGQPLQQLDILTMLGFVILIGTAVNNAILIVHQSLNHMREDSMSPRESILESVSTRIRPIFMTTTTTVFGLLPLVLFPGAGSELYRGLGSVVLGGLLVSTLFTLFLAPTLFSLTLDYRRMLVRAIWGREAELEAESVEHVEPESAPERPTLAPR